MDEIKLKALAKINLGLDVVRRREDGYHEVRMVMQTIHLYDQLLIQKSETPGIQIHSNLSFLPVNENNLVYKAGKLLMDEFDIHTGVSVELNKRIPVAAGMAGGRTIQRKTDGTWCTDRCGCTLLYYAWYSFGRGNWRETFFSASDGQMSGTDRKTGGFCFYQICISESET